MEISDSIIFIDISISGGAKFNMFDHECFDIKSPKDFTHIVNKLFFKFVISKDKGNPFLDNADYATNKDQREDKSVYGKGK